jgi:molybdopterin-synthase adenylyltransferase
MAGYFHHESLYRGPEMLQKLSALRLTLCGAGAVGSNLADNLVRHGAGKLRVIDHDRVEAHNISTQIYVQGDVGGWKVESLRNHLFRACGVEIDPLRKMLDARNAGVLLKDADLVIDAFDNTRARQCVQDQVRAAKLPCVHVGLYADYCEIVWDEQYRVPGAPAGEIEICDYPLARNIVLLAVAVATESILRWAADGSRASFSATLRDFAIRPLDAPADGR